MNFDILYSIAVDVIQKRSVQTQNVNDYVCVLMTQNNSIFTGISTSTIKDGKLVSVNAEDEAIRIMTNSNESRISALVVVNVHTLKPTNPCESCKLLMLELNPDNVQCLIMQEDKSFIPLSQLVDCIEQSIWDNGWGDSEDFPSVDPTMGDIFTPNGTNRFQNTQNTPPKSDSLQFNPMPQNQNSVNIYQTGYRSMYTPPQMGGSVYMESINSHSTLQTAVVEKSNSTFARQANNTTAPQGSRYKEMLKGIISDDVNPTDTSTKAPVAPTPTTDNTTIGRASRRLKSIHVKMDKAEANKPATLPVEPTPETKPRNVPSKKELKLLAKEKKKQAKKNSKILESIDKHSRT